MEEEGGTEETVLVVDLEGVLALRLDLLLQGDLDEVAGGPLRGPVGEGHDRTLADLAADAEGQPLFGVLLPRGRALGDLAGLLVDLLLLPRLDLFPEEVGPRAGSLGRSKSLR